MLDIGTMELFVVAILALVVVGPRELPKLLRTIGGFMRRVREMAAEFRSGVEELASEVEREVDPFADLRKEEGLRPGMSPQEVTEHIMANREAEEAATLNESEAQDKSAAEPSDASGEQASSQAASKPQKPESEA